ncbi:hypothetical protein CSA08_01335 [Candidatus Gracilibacteria bacterium]|nr:MAG: hypothetical protein CSA08_01335 [Candidatus Gracilibacteria bacterium]
MNLNKNNNIKINAQVADIFADEDLVLIKKLTLGKPLYVNDFDDTLYSRRMPLKDEGIKNNRGIDGYYYIIAIYSGLIHNNYKEKITDKIREKVKKLSDKEKIEALEKYVKKYYGRSNGKNILGHIGNIDNFVIKKPNLTSVIITAGIDTLQKLKLQYSGMFEVPTIIVESGKEKVKALINYIINNLGYIPSEITINEDKPEFFIKYGKVLTEILGIKINVNTIKINKEKNIAEIVKIYYFFKK